MNDHHRKNYFMARSTTVVRELNERLAEANLRQVKCPVCGAMDNDWPPRRGLCIRCYCSAVMHLDGTSSQQEAAFAAMPERAMLAHARKWRPGRTSTAKTPEEAKAARSEKDRKYNQANSEKRKAWREANKAYLREYSRNYHHWKKMKKTT